MEIFTGHFLTALLQVMLVNIVLSGDNAVVIALAARDLEPRHRTLAILWGSLSAVVLRVILTIVAVQMLQVPYLQFVGALLLVWISVKLLIDDGDHNQTPDTRADLFGAVRTILIADVVMSLDNTLAIAAVAKGDATLLVIALVLSIPLIMWGSTLIMKVMDRYPIVVYIGAGLIAWTAGDMIDSDAAMRPWLPSVLHETLWLPLCITAVVVGYGWWRNRRAGRKPRAVP